ncbi:hypothetical protein [Megamonas funiformis]|uniref:hypothetical protein n=1 Tax=Megamonas funiformis TaxID=437897 RepID=UPI003F867550
MTPIIIEDEAFEENILEEEKTTEKQIKEENIQTTIKLDYSLETPEERNELVKKIINNTPSEQLTPRYLEILSDYIIFAMDKQERKQKQILTDNHMVTVNKRETSFEGLVGRLENGEDGIYNMIANDKNIIFTPKFQITQQDIAEIPELKQLVDAIAEVEKAEKKAVGKKKFLLKKQLIAMRQDQYVIRSAYKPPIYCMNAIKSFSKIDFDENVSISGNDEIEDNSLVSFFNPKHVSALLCNYSRLKEDAWGKFYSDSYFLMEDLDTLIEKTLRDSYPMYYDLLIYKIDGKQNLEIQSLLNQKHNVKHSVEYISSLWRNKIPKLLSEQAQEDYLIWYYTTQKKGKWKKCSRCGEIKLAHNKFFSKNKTSKDHFYSICKCCRNKKNK